MAKTIEQVELNAESGYKFITGSSLKGVKCDIYINEFILGDNTYLVELNNTKFTYVNHGVINYMITKDERFCNFTYNHFQNIMMRSIFISGNNEKERLRFFNKIKDKINNRIAPMS